jgi:hypothetical protein
LTPSVSSFPGVNPVISGSVVLSLAGLAAPVSGRPVLFDKSLPQSNDAGALLREVDIVGSHDNRLAARVQLTENPHGLVGHHAIQVARRFVREDHYGFVNQAPTQSDALPLTDAQL